MITEAIILGQVEAAIYREDDRWQAIRLAPAGKGTIDCTRSLALLMSSCAERRALAEPLSNLAELETHLRKWSRRHQALTLLISGMDSQLTNGTRRTCIEAAEELLWDTDTSHFVRARLLGCPVPEEADIGGGLRLCMEIRGIDTYTAGGAATKRVATGRITVEGLYDALREVETGIPAVRRILDEELFFGAGSEDNPETTRRAIIDAGVVADAVLALAAKSENALKQLVVDYSENPSLVAELGKPRPVLKRFGGYIHELIEKKSENLLIEEKFSRDLEPLTKFSAPGPVLEAAKFAIPRSHSTPVGTDSSEVSVKISEPAYL